MEYIKYKQSDSLRHVDMIMDVLKSHAERFLSPELLATWEREQREALIGSVGFSYRQLSETPLHLHRAEGALLSLKVAEKLQQGESLYDVMLFAARTNCSDRVDKYFAVDEAFFTLGYDKAKLGSLEAEMNSILETLDDFKHTHRDEFRIRGRASDFPRELFERYDAHQKGVEYQVPIPETTPAELKIRGAQYVHPDRLEDWNEYVDKAFAEGPLAVSTAVSTLDILETYETGSGLQDVKDMTAFVTYMCPCDTNVLYDNLFRSHDGNGFGDINLDDKLYLIGIGLREPELSVPQAHKACMERAATILPDDRLDAFSRNIDSALAWGSHMSKQVMAGLDYIEAIKNGVSLEEVKERFQADERFGGDMQTSVAIFVERFSEIEGLRAYLDKDGPAPTDPREGPTGPTGPEEFDGPNGPDDIDITIPGE